MGTTRRGMVFCDRHALRRLTWLFAILLILHQWMVGTWLKVPGERYRGPFLPLDAEETACRSDLRRTVGHLAGTIGERCLISGHGLTRAAAWLTAELRGEGYQVRRQEFNVMGETCANLIVEVPGVDRPEEIVVVGAHYDTIPGCPGANDNGSGVASTLWLAREFADARPARTLRLLFFANEEPPFFWTDNQGSLVNARASAAEGERIVAMLTPETLGYYTSEPRTQTYPGPFALYFGRTGDYAAFVANVGSRRLLRQTVGAFREHCRFASEGVAVPGAIPGVGWSDHWSFWQVGYQGVMISDTAPFRYPHYHQPTDTPDQLTYDPFARVTVGLGKVVGEMVEG